MSIINFPYLQVSQLWIQWLRNENICKENLKISVELILKLLPDVYCDEFMGIKWCLSTVLGIKNISEVIQSIMYIYKGYNK